MTAKWITILVGLVLVLALALPLVEAGKGILP